MKKTILTTAIISALLISCNDNKNESKTTEEATEVTEKDHTKEMAAESHSMNNAWVEEIKLDEGDKWDANLETTEGVDKMLSLVKSSQTESVKEYHSLAADLNETKNFVVKKCTMKGPSHDNLHVFLHPLIEKINALGKISSTDEGAKIKESIKENLEGYYTYFQ
ncbi:hypothetical protein RBU60_11930 [Mesonia sp. MT50]|uniref:Lipoprotein n=1 Tax=Mesonia profundi TaxID=3070998 RepID=A0ABU1A3L6_9FLAO|nr:hypothetical protein [Mesonia profundi]MDQ7918287.1 hypothetical protein [Mesonia profundi]